MNSTLIERLSSKTKLGTLKNISTNLNTNRPQIHGTKIEIEREREIIAYLNCTRD